MCAHLTTRTRYFRLNIVTFATKRKHNAALFHYGSSVTPIGRIVIELFACLWVLEDEEQRLFKPGKINRLVTVFVRHCPSGVIVREVHSTGMTQGRPRGVATVHALLRWVATLQETPLCPRSTAVVRSMTPDRKLPPLFAPIVADYAANAHRKDDSSDAVKTLRSPFPSIAICEISTPWLDLTLHCIDVVNTARFCSQRRR